MLTGEQVVLRAYTRSDVERIARWDLDVETWRLASDRPWVPKTPADVVKEWEEGKAFRVDDTNVPFVVDVGGQPVGGVSLWDVDVHNRRGHVGLAMAPDSRGKGWGTDAVRVLLAYAFLDRGLNRVQLETLATNAAMLGAARKAGFVQEGVWREDAWVHGEFADQVVMSVLRSEWLARQ